MPDPSPHPTLAFALDVADKLIKLVAVLLGGIWTYWNYRKSRTYQKRLELTLAASPYRHQGTFLEVRLSLKILGGAQHRLQQNAALCQIKGIFSDLSEETLDVTPVFIPTALSNPARPFGTCFSPASPMSPAISPGYR